MKKLFGKQNNKGMTYIELIVVLSIFSIMSSIILFNYSQFRARVEIKDLASNIALRIVEAQKASLSGSLPPATSQYLITTTWKPSYGVYFDSSTADDPSDNNIPYNQKFVYFVDLDNTSPPQNSIFDGFSSNCTGECLEKITITNGNKILELSSVNAGSSCTVGNGQPLNNLSIVFRRPDSSARVTVAGAPLSGFSCVIITIESSASYTSTIKIYPSGRVQVN